MAKQPKPGEWQYTVGEPPVQLTAYERRDKGDRIYTRVWDGKRIGSKKALCAAIRDERGKIDPAREQEARAAALARHGAILAGLDTEDAQAGPLTLPAGFRKVLHPKAGKYVGKTDHRQDMTHAAKRIVRILGRDLLWSQVKHAHYRKLWRALAEEFAANGESYGLRQAERIVGFLQSASRWLQTEELIEPGTALPAPGWMNTMRSEWERILEAPVPDTKKPRYSEVESRRLWAALPTLPVDPRLWLGMEIGAELRLGQVPRSRRSDVREVDGELYSVRVHGQGKKLGELVVLTPEQRAVLHYHLTEGYLRVLEAEYRAGRLDDYYLLPGGRLRYWEKSKKLPYPYAQVKNAGRAATEAALGDWWEVLEEVAEVDHLDGRRWYGLRRLQSDLAEDVETDARVLNKMGAWKHTATREHYQDEGRTKIQEKAAEARRKIRPRNDLHTETSEEAE